MHAQDTAIRILIALRDAGIDINDPAHEDRALAIIAEHLPPPVPREEPTNPPHG